MRIDDSIQSIRLVYLDKDNTGPVGSIGQVISYVRINPVGTIGSG